MLEHQRPGAAAAAGDLMRWSSPSTQVLRLIPDAHRPRRLGV
jgi:hypothetical protein